MRDKMFIMAGRILANRGLDKKVTYSNCYVIKAPDDNIESIFESASKLARTFSYGGGVGVDLKNLRPRGAKVNNAAKTTSGAVSFMDLYNMVTNIIGQDGRRGALMISIPCNHPDIEEFIDVKTDLNKVTKANISIRISDKFMHAVREGKDYTLRFEIDNENFIEKVVNAESLFNKIAKNNWLMGEPGMLFWDRIECWNLLSEYDDFKFAGVNPCAEEPLPAGGSCLLGSINLSEFVFNPFTDNAIFDMEKFENAIDVAVRALNDVLDEGLERHPLQEQRDSVREYRQIGLGIVGLADMLIKMKLAYGSTKSLAICEMIAFTLLNKSIETSAYIAKEKGAFEKFDYEKTSQSPFFIENVHGDVKELVKKYGLRNSQLLTVAPTGSISTMLGISGGIEPIFALSYTRKTESLHDEDKYYKVYTPIVREYMDKFGITSEEDLPEFFVTSHDLDYKHRIEMQAVWQKFIDASISSTVNLDESATIEDVEDVYMYAWEMGLKGITVFRNNCLRQGVLTVETSKTTCPECGEEIENSGGCVECKNCGWAKCSL